MENSNIVLSEVDVVESETAEKKTFVEPKLTWVEPELVEHGHVETVAGFFGSFSP